MTIPLVAGGHHASPSPQTLTAPHRFLTGPETAVIGERRTQTLQTGSAVPEVKNCITIVLPLLKMQTPGSHPAPLNSNRWNSAYILHFNNLSR